MLRDIVGWGLVLGRGKIFYKYRGRNVYRINVKQWRNQYNQICVDEYFEGKFLLENWVKQIRWGQFIASCKCLDCEYDQIRMMKKYVER